MTDGSFYSKPRLSNALLGESVREKQALTSQLSPWL